MGPAAPSARRKPSVGLWGATLLAAVVVACDREGNTAPDARLEEGPAIEGEDSELPSAESLEQALGELSELYERARGAGETAPGELARWTAEDLKRIGDWEYRVEALPAGAPEQLADTLNGWGEERWEVFWIERGADGYTVFLKRSARSYLKHVPIGDLLRLLPSGDGA